jgi:DNA-3-methyladenine glycosylase
VLAGHVLEVAPRLLGGVLRHGEVAVRLTEVEAYDGPDDPGSHAFTGRTARNAVMFGPPGRLYVYFTYGMHHCCNVVVGADGDPAAVLLRAGEVVAGVEVARQRRGSSDRDLARGPARLCQALGIDLRHNGTDLSTGPVLLGLGPGEDAPQTPGRSSPAARVRTGPRVGLRKAAERPWRFWVEGEPTVSTYRPAVVRRRAT